jgi:hypothetical protein
MENPTKPIFVLKSPIEAITNWPYRDFTNTILVHTLVTTSVYCNCVRMNTFIRSNIRLDT